MNNETQTVAILAFVYRIEIITLPILIVFGSIFNIMTFIVMRRRRMRISSTCFYMAALAVTDTLVLWTGCLNQWFYIIHVPTLVAKSNLTCKLLPFLFVFFADASVWIIVCMSFERYLAVSRPLRASQMCTTKRAKWVLLIMAAVFILIDGHFLLTLELEILNDNRRVCHPKLWARHFVGKIFVFIDALKYSAIPFCILLLLSILIIQRVFQAENISAQLQNLRLLHPYRQYSASSSVNCTAHSSTLAVGSVPANGSSSNTRIGRRVTFMLLSVSIAFCVFSAPMSLMQIVQSIVTPDYYDLPLAIGKAVAELCQYINHSCNFFLYALTGRIFRRELIRLFFPTRFGDRRAIPVAAGLRGMGLSARAGFIAQTVPSSSRHPSIYCTENHRYNLVNKQTNNTARLSPLYPVEYGNEVRRPSNRFSVVKLPLLPSNESPILVNRYRYSQPDTQVRFLDFWGLFGKKKARRATEDGIYLFNNALQLSKHPPSTV